MFLKRLTISVVSALVVVAVASRVNRPVGRADNCHPLLEQVVGEVVMDVTTPRTAVESISKAAGVRINIDVSGVDPFRGNPVPSDDPPIVLHDIRVADAIFVMLGHFSYADQAAVEQRDGAIYIERRQDLPPVRLVGRFYEVADLQFGDGLTDIVGSLSDENAQVNDPLAAGDYLWIRRTKHGHRQVEDVLDFLRDALPPVERN